MTCWMSSSTIRRSTCRWRSCPATCSSCTTTRSCTRERLRELAEPDRHRHLLRLWLAPASARPLPEIFAPRYGSVAPGERGGIVDQGNEAEVPLEAE
jgi:hypothetical protein